MQQIDPLQVLHNDAFGTQVCAPHLFDEFSVVSTLNENAAGTRYARSRFGGGKRARRSAARPVSGTLRNDERYWFAVDEKSATERKESPLASAIFELDHSRADTDHRTAEAVFDHFDYEISLRLHTGNLALPARAPTRRQHVCAIPIVHQSSEGETIARREANDASDARTSADWRPGYHATPIAE